MVKVITTIYIEQEKLQNLRDFCKLRGMSVNECINDLITLYATPYFDKKEIKELVEDDKEATQ